MFFFNNHYLFDIVKNLKKSKWLTGAGKNVTSSTVKMKLALKKHEKAPRV